VITGINQEGKKGDRTAPAKVPDCTRELVDYFRHGTWFWLPSEKDREGPSHFITQQGKRGKSPTTTISRGDFTRGKGGLGLKKRSEGGESTTQYYKNCLH